MPSHGGEFGFPPVVTVLAFISTDPADVFADLIEAQAACPASGTSTRITATGSSSIPLSRLPSTP